jgi:hypothetical protein
MHKSRLFSLFIHRSWLNRDFLLHACKKDSKLDDHELQITKIINRVSQLNKITPLHFTSHKKYRVLSDNQ